jgi:predicted PurR-regulated permease PerM
VKSPSRALFILKKVGGSMTLQEITAVITVVIAILSFIGGIAIFLFKKIVIEPLQKSIDGLNKTIQRLETSTNKQLEIHDKEIDLLKITTTRHDEQIKTLFNKKGVGLND